MHPSGILYTTHLQDFSFARTPPRCSHLHRYTSKNSFDTRPEIVVLISSTDNESTKGTIEEV
jgi:hypothetical protein